MNQAMDPFQRMLVWSFALHFVLFAAIGVASRFRPQPALPIPDNTVFISVGAPGPGTGGGSVTPVKEEDPKPVEPPPEPKKEPTVVRPTEEDRNLLPEPEAKPTKRPPKKPKPDSGVRGPDAASADSAKQAQAGAPGLPGLGIGGRGGGSGFDQDFEYAYYVQQMLNRIHQNWQRTAVRGTTTAIIRFTILKDGSIQNPEVEETSRVPLLDRISLRAVMLADPLPPLPNSYPRDRVGVHLMFTYSDQY